MKTSETPSQETKFSNALFCKEILDKEAEAKKEPASPTAKASEIKPAPQPPDQSSETEADRLEGPSPARKASALRWKEFCKEHEHWRKQHEDDDKQPGEGWMRKVMHWLNIR